jgi:hypothetical protein
VNRTPLPFLLCCWWFSSWWSKAFDVFMCSWTSLGAVLDETKPPFPLFVVLMMGFFLVVSFLVLFLVFLNLFWCYSSSLVSFLVNQTPTFPSMLHWWWSSSSWSWPS